MQVVRDNTPPAQAGENGKTEEKADNGNGTLFWFLVGGVAGAVTMHIAARKMQEYAGGMYSARARLQSRINPEATMNDAMRMRAAEAVDDEESWI